MARIFTFEQICMGEVPCLDSFRVVREAICRELDRCDGVIGAVICGSVLWGLQSRGSDIDCLVLSDPQRSRETTIVRQELKLFAHRLHVPLTFIDVDTSVGNVSMHSITSGFMGHLRKAVAGGGVIKFDPLVQLGVGASDLQEGVRTYLRFQLNRLKKSYDDLLILDRAGYHTMLKKGLESPIHVARQVLQFHSISPEQDSKVAVVEAYKLHAKDCLGESLQLFYDTQRCYADVLEEQLVNPNQADYDSVLKRIEALVPCSITFVRANALMIGSI